MVNLDKLHNNEAYALKVLTNLIDKYFTSETEKIEKVKSIFSIDGCIPGRTVGALFYQKEVSNEDQKIIQEVINIYG